MIRGQMSGWAPVICEYRCEDCDARRRIVSPDNARCICGHSIWWDGSTCRHCGIRWRDGQIWGPPKDLSPRRMFGEPKPCSECGSVSQCRRGFKDDCDSVYCLPCWGMWYSYKFATQDVTVQVIGGECFFLGGDKATDADINGFDTVRAVRAAVVEKLLKERPPSQIKRLDPLTLVAKEKQIFSNERLWDSAPIIPPWRVRLIRDDVEILDSDDISAIRGQA
jgi:hypothetical protein